MKCFLILPALLASSIASASGNRGLPPDEAIERAIEDHPLVQSALARRDAARETARGLRAGPHEFSVSGSYVERRIDRDGTYSEYDATLERGIRLPGKAALDRKVGELGMAAAEYRVADTRHRAALLFNELWWDWLTAQADVKAAEAAVANLSSALSAVERRVTLQDAAPVDADQARAALATARLSLEQRQARAAIARSRIEVQFPSLPLPVEAPELPEPELPPTGLGLLRDQVLVQNHSMPGAQAEADRQSALALRAQKDRIADPTVGLRLFSERGGAERGIGVVASIPIGGKARAAIAGQAAADARAAAADFAAARYTAQETAATDYAEASKRWTAWQRSIEARSSSEKAAQRLRQGYRLGGVDLADLLYAERQAQEALNAETAARADALRAFSRLRIDAHELWPNGHQSGVQ
jgi:outer membrane protein TolC